MPVDDRAPSPKQLVQMLRIHMWRDDIDDDSRWYAENSAAVIELLMGRCVRLSQKLEHLEATHDRT